MGKLTKVKVTLEQAMKAMRGRRGIDLLFLNLSTRLGWMVNVTQAALPPGKRTGTRWIQGWVMAPEGALDEEHSVGFNAHNKDSSWNGINVWKIWPLKPECEVSQVDVQEWIDAGKGIEVSCATADED